MQRGNPKAVSFSSVRAKVTSSASWLAKQHLFPGQAASMDEARGTSVESEVKEKKGLAEALWLFIWNQCFVSCGASGINLLFKFVVNNLLLNNY